MAIYTFRNDELDLEKDFQSSISEYDEMKKELEAQGWRRIYKPLRLVDGATGDVYSKSDGGWKETLQRIKGGAGRQNTINIP